MIERVGNEIIECSKDFATPEEIKRRQDELLDSYSLYLETKIQVVKEEVITKAYLLHLIDPNFCFVV